MTRTAPTTAPAHVRPARTYVGPSATRDDAPGARPARPGWRTLLGVTASYLGAVALATWPMARTFGSRLAGDPSDPLMHLWLMRWARTCLLEGRSPFFNPGVHAPVGVPLGFYPTMHVASFFYLLLSPLGLDDVVALNLIWLVGLVGTGVAAFLLATWTIGDRGAAWLAGLGAMLSGPMMLHAHGHTELLQMWSYPAFLVGWIRFVDRPGRGTLLASAALTLLLTATAPYFLILGVFPACWYLLWAGWRVDRPDRRGWVGARLGWLLGFVALLVPGFLLLFSSHLWAVAHGHHVARPRQEFFAFRAAPSSYLVPTPENPLGRLLARGDLGASAVHGRAFETSGYLGLVPILALAGAALRRSRFPRAGYWWTALAILAVLSLGGKAIVGGRDIPLPAGWTWSVFPPFRLIRVPTRFNLFVAVTAAVPVAAGLRDLLGRLPRGAGRNAGVGALGLLILLDQNMAPFPTAAIPPVPDYYAELARRTPSPAILDAPSFPASKILPSTALWGYWQALHGGSTTATYSSLPNDPFDALVVDPSPWAGRSLLDPGFLADPARATFGLVRGVDALDYAGLFLREHRLDYVVLHQGPAFEHGPTPGSARLKALTAGALSREDADVAIYDQAKFPPPRHPAWLVLDGWRPRAWSPPGATWSHGALREARFLVVVPEGDRRPLVVRLVDAVGNVRPRAVRLLEGPTVLASWTLGADRPATLASPPLDLPPGRHELTVRSDGADTPRQTLDRLDNARTPYSFRLNAIEVR